MDFIMRRRRAEIEVIAAQLFVDRQHGHQEITLGSRWQNRIEIRVRATGRRKVVTRVLVVVEIVLSQKLPLDIPILRRLSRDEKPPTRTLLTVDVGSPKHV